MRIMHLNRAAVMIHNFLLPMIEAQRSQGHYVCVCTADEPDTEKIRKKNIDVFTHGLKRNIYPVNLLKTLSRIKGLLKDNRIDVLICHSPLGAALGRIAAKLAKTPKVIYLAHGLPFAPAQNPLKWFAFFMAEKILSNLTDAIIVMNNYDENTSKKHLMRNPQKVFRVPAIGVDLNKFKNKTDERKCMQMRKELNISNNQTIILCTAFLTKTKGIFVYLKAAEKISRQKNNACFLLAGSGPCMNKLKKAIKAKRLEDNFKLLGWRDDVDQLLQLADIFVLPTFYPEGLPASILEAMACAKPVVATKHRGCEEAVIEGQTGFLVPVKKTALLIERITELIDNPQLRHEMGCAGRKRAEEMFEVGKCTKEIVKATEKAIKTN